MKHVIVLFLFLNLGCNNNPTPEPKAAYPSFISIKGDSFFHENKKIESGEIKTLFKKIKAENKKKEKPVLGLHVKKGSKNGYVIFIMELGRMEGIDLVLKVEE